MFLFLITLRSLAFNASFYLYNTLACLLIGPFVLLPRRHILKIVRLYVRGVYILEKHIAGIDYEVRGQSNLPKNGSFIVAAKHQSSYETFKLHMLFDDPSIILKRELFKIPIWGWFLKAVDVIAIDRSNKEEAVSSILKGARRMRKQGRPIVIFPQGTRVNINTPVEKKPYKGGIIKMYRETNLPVIPLAMNSGVYWPRKGFLKYPGTVVFEYLPPLPEGLADKEALAYLRTNLEGRSSALVNEAFVEDKRLLLGRS